jgi:hypothetical protein
VPLEFTIAPNNDFTNWKMTFTFESSTVGFEKASNLEFHCYIRSTQTRISTS